MIIAHTMRTLHTRAHPNMYTNVNKHASFTFYLTLVLLPKPHWFTHLYSLFMQHAREDTYILSIIRIAVYTHLLTSKWLPVASLLLPWALVPTLWHSWSKKAQSQGEERGSLDRPGRVSTIGFQVCKKQTDAT